MEGGSDGGRGRAVTGAQIPRSEWVWWRRMAWRSKKKEVRGEDRAAGDGTRSLEPEQ